MIDNRTPPRSGRSGRRADGEAPGERRALGRSGLRGATTARNALETLEAVARLVEQSRQPVALAAIALEAGHGASSVYRYVQVLVARGYLKHVDGGYGLGSTILSLAGVTLGSLDVRREAQPILHELARRTGETVHLVVPDGLDVVYIDKVEGRHAVLVNSRIGARAPATCTAVGKVILAFGPPEARLKAAQQLVRRTARTQIDSRLWLRHLDAVVRCGYAVDMGENEDGIHCVAAPIQDHEGRVAAALSISGPAGRMPLGRLTEFAPYVMAAAHEVARRLGYRSDSGRSEPPGPSPVGPDVLDR